MINEIRETLDNDIEAFVSIPFVRENTHYEPTMLDPWCRSTLLPAETRNLTRGATPVIRVNGLYQIDVFYPSGSGTDANTITGALLTHLYSDRIKTINNSVYEVQIINVWEDVSTTTDDWYNARITLKYETFMNTKEIL